jgi:hypothetical protein
VHQQSHLSRKELHNRVLKALRTMLGEPELIAVYVRKRVEEDRRLRTSEREQGGTIERRLTQISVALDKLVDALIDGSIDKARIKA